MSTDLATFLFEVVNFLLLVALLGFLLFRPVRRALDAERARHAQAAEELEAQREELSARRDALALAEREAQQARDEEATRAAATLERQRESAEQEARSAAAAERARLDDELAARRTAEVERLADEVGRVSGAAVASLLAELDGPSLDAALLRGALEQLRGLDVTAATVEVARPLDPATRAAIAQSLPSSDVRVVPELGAGVRIVTVSGQVDASARSLAREAAVQASDAIRNRRADAARTAPVAAEGHGHDG